MWRRLQRTAFLLTATVGLLGFGLQAEPASACPMCKTANETATQKENTRPKAYMYSILFMLAMPATLLTGFGIGFYRLSKKQAAASGEDEFGEETDHEL